MGVLESFVVKLLLGLLAYIQAREDLKRRVRDELALEGNERSLAALRWMADAAARPDGGAELHARDGAATIVGVDPLAPDADRRGDVPPQ